MAQSKRAGKGQGGRGPEQLASGTEPEDLGGSGLLSLPTPWQWAAWCSSAGGKPPQLLRLLGGQGPRVLHLLSVLLEKLLQVPCSQFVKSFPRYIAIRRPSYFRISHGSQGQRAEPYIPGLGFEEL